VAAATTVVTHNVYSSFGQLVSSTNPATGDPATVACTIGYAGGIYDPALSSEYFASRWYDAESGTWFSPDPADADINTYRYCGNGPTDGTDPSGLEEGAPTPIFKDMADALGVPSMPKPAQKPWTDQGYFAFPTAGERGGPWSAQTIWEQQDPTLILMRKGVIEPQTVVPKHYDATDAMGDAVTVMAGLARAAAAVPVAAGRAITNGIQSGLGYLESNIASDSASTIGTKLTATEQWEAAKGAFPATLDTFLGCPNTTPETRQWNQWNKDTLDDMPYYLGYVQAFTSDVLVPSVLTAGVGMGLEELSGMGLADPVEVPAAPVGPTVPELPAFDEKTTHGVLITNEGEVVPLQSGSASPTYANYPAASHVEGKAAIVIRESSSSGGVVYHNNPNGTCSFCNSQVPTLLPEGAELRVVPPAGTVPPSARWYVNPKPYVGNSSIPKPNPQLGQ
jgi:RHS repeat-associated protein